MLPEILGVVCEGGRVWAPLTPITTFRDVAACVRDPGDPLPCILEHSPLGVRVVGHWERPLELLRLWAGLRGEISYHAHPSSALASPSPSSDEDGGVGGVGGVGISPWELYELKDELKGMVNPRVCSTREWRPPVVPPAPLAPPGRLDDSDELVVVSSDECDASFTSHHYHSPSSLPRRAPHFKANPFPRGRPLTASLPLPPAPPRPQGRDDPHSAHRKRVPRSQHAKENGVFKGSFPISPQTLTRAPKQSPVVPQGVKTSQVQKQTLKTPQVQSQGAKTPGTDTNSPQNTKALSPQDSLSPIISRKQKYTPAEYKQAAGRTGHKTPASPRRKPAAPQPRNTHKLQRGG
ncbi:serine/threonine-protein kinase Warts-like [Portunus trituberculatus]|uniref:serine/threonine-protein kinase Warts-like n=1 Tax=Portunus trituberculatus TaxID=210409 RepID=UPI001E1CBEB0|nr:serine/threonine-protein kinase Warts-like [Portunus trituberculatus]XP_045103460.1 serine/threonine-protein kinase Warts-like [Portunus trituberculatus]XP_045103470.1 serine/threonine-protein kinase Warts-like [Portunus trituberculatus]